MERIYVNQIQGKIGQKILLKGWVHVLRDHGKIKFLILRDITGTLQCVINSNIIEAFKTSETLTQESVVSVTGVIVEKKQAPGEVELQVESIEILSLASPELPIPIVEKNENETEQSIRLDWRWLDLRKPEKALIFKVWTAMEEAFREYWVKNNFIEIHSPKFMSTPSESGAELFEVKYFDRTAYLAQSPQFYKQMGMAAGFEKVFEVGPIFRANPSFTSRHDTEFTGYDMEISFINSFQDVICEEEQLLMFVIKTIKEQYGEQVKKFYGREIIIPTSHFPQVTMKEAKSILAKLGVTSEEEGDLNQEEEIKLCEYIKREHGHEFVFVTKYPISVRPFYHMRDTEDSNLTNSFDLLWNGLEITTGAQREHRYDILVKQAKEKGLTLEPIQTYLNFFKFGCPPHGGCGIGPSRIIMKLLGVSNVREVTYLYRGVKRLTP